MRKWLATLLAAVMCGCMMTGCSGKEESSTAEAPAENSSAADVQEDENSENSENSEVSAASGNTFIITLYPEDAPITCENFENLVEQGFYDGVSFHRVVEDFMAQGGDPTGTGAGGSENTIKGEFSSNGVDNPLSHKRGIVSMARSNMPDSASSQFFICYTDDDTFLDGSYAAFGEVTEGMEVVDSFLKVERSYNSGGELASPNTPIIMEKVTMIEDDENGNPRVQVVMNDFLNPDSQS